MVKSLQEFMLMKTAINSSEFPLLMLILHICVQEDMMNTFQKIIWIGLELAITNEYVPEDYMDWS
jgi:hypothetical protein